MYSGITCGLFEVISVEKQTGLITYQVRLNEKLIDNLTLGASVAIDGVCQTVVAIAGLDVTFQAIQETLDRTTLKALYVGRWVSVERSLRYGDEIGGHEVAGHVIGTARIAAVVFTEQNLTLTLACPSLWMKYILPKGFIAVDGSSLTVGEVSLQTLESVDNSQKNSRLAARPRDPWMPSRTNRGDGTSGSSTNGQHTLNIHLIPETIRLTNLGKKRVDDLVNIELDHRTQIIVETVERVLASRFK